MSQIEHPPLEDAHDEGRYARVLYAAYRGLARRTIDYLLPEEQGVGDALRNEIRRASDAAAAVDQVMPTLLQPYTDDIDSYQGRVVRRSKLLERLPCRELSEEQDDLLLALFLLRDDAHEDRSALVAIGLALDITLAFTVGAFVDEQDAMLGARAYTEASALLTHVRQGIRPPGAAVALGVYYIGRRLRDKDVTGLARVLLVHGPPPYEDAQPPRGPLYMWAWYKFNGLPEVERERAAEAYCDRFIHALDVLPVEALLCPPLAFGYALRAAKRAALKTLPKELPISLLDDEPDRTSPAALAVATDHGRYGKLPHFDLALRHFVDHLSYQRLGDELGLSKQAVKKRVDVFLKRASDLRNPS